MNISQIRAKLRAAFNLGQREDRLSQAGSKDQARWLRLSFDQSLIGLDDLPVLEWIKAQKVADDPMVDELLRDFADDPTADAATILVQTIVTAYLKG